MGDERTVGSYTLLREIASGGMATVYLGHGTGKAESSRPGAIKRFHPDLASERDFATIVLDGARLRRGGSGGKSANDARWATQGQALVHGAGARAGRRRHGACRRVRGCSHLLASAHESPLVLRRG